MDDVGAHGVQELGVVRDQQAGAGLQVLDVLRQPLHRELQKQTNHTHTYSSFHVLCVGTSTSIAPDRDGWWARPAATCPGSTTWRETKRAGRKQKVFKSHVFLCLNVLERWPTFILHPPERVPTPASMAAAVRDTPKPMSVNIFRTVPSSAPDAITCAHICMYVSTSPSVAGTIKRGMWDSPWGRS